MSAKIKEYRSNFCTFLGKRCNVEILHAYIEKALELSIIDRYFIIDMTREFSDHEFLKEEYNRLSKKFNKRVFLRNSEEQSLKLTKERTPNDVDWGAFYKIFTEFTDEDVVIKCDDDILFIELERLKAAIELRYQNKTPFIMHANCINNGVCAYHQYAQNIWKFNSDLLKMYPSAGLAGPIFSDNGEAAEKMHDQFVGDITKNKSNLSRYKLKENIYLLQRISINFTFFLGKDRDLLKNIEEQDEYLVSCKIPQMEDRPNMLIADFIVSHYSYKSQKILRNQEGLARYSQLATEYLKTSIQNNLIKTNHDKVIAINNEDNYLVAPTQKERFCIKNISSSRYLSFKFHKFERVIHEDKDSKIYTGKFLLTNTLGESEGVDTLFEFADGVFSNQAQMLKAHASPSSQQYATHFINKFFNHGYKKNKLIINEAENGLYIQDKDGKYLIRGKTKKGNPIFYFQKIDQKFVKQDAGVWEINEFKNPFPITMKVHREGIHDLENDPTYATSEDKNAPNMKNARGFYWTIKNHLWRMREKEQTLLRRLFKCPKRFCISVINDEESLRFLAVEGSRISLSRERYYWQIKNSSLQDPQSKKYIHLSPRLDLKMDPYIIKSLV